MRSRGTLAFGPYRLDLADERLWRAADPIPLSPKTFAVLAYLAGRADQLVTKDELLDAIWPETHVSDAVLKVIISDLRRVLADDPKAPRFIGTVHRRGYRFIAQVAIVADAPPAPAAPAFHLVGRDAHLELLRHAFARAAAGERQLVFITGESGIGKTALVDAFAGAVLDTGARCARGQCLDHHGSGEAYLPMLETLGELCRSSRGAEVAELLRRHAPSWMAHLPGLLAGEAAGTGAEVPASSRERMQREMADLLEVVTAAQPLVLILEDMHWSDTSSVDLLSRLAHRRAPARLLIVATYRPVDVILAQHALKALKQRLDQQRLCAEIHLPYLGPPDVDAYLRLRFGGRELPEGLIDTISERSGGNPLFVVNLVDDLLARGWLAVDDAAVRMIVSGERIRAEVPDGVRQVIDTLVERLPAAQAAQLEAASVAGEEFSTAAVAAALGQGIDDVEHFCERAQRQLRYLEAHGVTALAGGNACGRYRFRHALYRDAFYQRIGRARRGVLHRRIGEWLETQRASAAELARHFLEAADAGCADKAILYSRRAAERAVELFAYPEAAGHYRTAIDMLGRSSGGSDQRADECRLHIALGESLERSGTIALAAGAFLRATELARQLGSGELLAHAALGRGRGHHPVSAADPELIALLEEALRYIDPQPGLLRACVLARLDTALSPIPGAHERREPMAREALDYARRHGDADTLLLVLQYTRWAFTGRDSPDELRESADTLARLAAAAPNLETALQLALIRLSQLHELGDTATATAELERFRNLADTAGILWFQWFAQRLLAYRALEEGRFADAERCMQEALAIGQRTDHPNVRPTFGAQRICLYLQCGRFAELEPELAVLSARRPEQFTTRAALAYARTQLGDLAGARRELDAMAANDFAQIPRDSLWLMVLARLVEVCVELGDRPRADTLRALFEPYADRVIGAGASFASVGHGSRYLALLAQTCGAWETADAHFARAIAIHERMGATPWLAQTHYEYGRLLSERPPGATGRAAARRQAAAHLDRARSLADTLAMHGITAALQRLDA